MIRRLSNHEKQSRYNQLYNQQKTFSRISHHVGGGSIFLAGEVSQCGIPGGFHQLPARTGTRRSRTICPDSEIRRFGRHLPQFPGEERRCLGRHIPQMRDDVDPRDGVDDHARLRPGSCQGETPSPIAVYRVKPERNMSLISIGWYSVNSDGPHCRRRIHRCSWISKKLKLCHRPGSSKAIYRFICYRHVWPTLARSIKFIQSTWQHGEANHRAVAADNPAVISVES